MSSNPANEKTYLRDDSGVRRAAMLVIDELGVDAAKYAAARAMVLQRRGDEIGASAWRRIAPVIEEMQRKKAPVLTTAHADADYGRVRQSAFKGLRENKPRGR